jgi:small subunit ribosomal protein S20
MAKNKSEIKRIKTSKRKRLENAPYKSLVKTFMKKYFKVLEVYETTPTEENFQVVKTFLSLAYSKIDKAKKKKIFHQNTASRKKSRLGKALTKIELKTTS